MKELYRFRQFLAEGVIKEAYNLPDSDSTTDKYVNNHWDSILKDILRAHTDLRNSKGGESIPERPSQLDIDIVLGRFDGADEFMDVDPNVYDEYFDFYDMYLVTQRDEENTKSISDEDYPKGNYDGYTKRDDLPKLSEGKLLKEKMSLEVDDDFIELSADSGEYDGDLNDDGTVDFSVVYDDGTEFDDYNWKDVLGPQHAFVQISKKIPTKVEAAGDYVMITVDLEDLKNLLK